MNYEKLNILSDKVAFYLNNKGVKKGDLVYIDVLEVLIRLSEFWGF